MFVSEHDDDTFPSVAELRQTTANQLAPDLAALVLGQNGHRGQGNSGHRPVRRLHRHPAE